MDGSGGEKTLQEGNFQPLPKICVSGIYGLYDGHNIKE